MTLNLPARPGDDQVMIEVMDEVMDEVAVACGPGRDKGRCQPPDGTSPVGAVHRFRWTRLHVDHPRRRRPM
jgi:hypothetical protein